MTHRAELDSVVSLYRSTQPFYRPHLVEDVRRRIGEGRYFVPAEQIVEKLLGCLIVGPTG